MSRRKMTARALAGVFVLGLGAALFIQAPREADGQPAYKVEMGELPEVTVLSSVGRGGFKSNVPKVRDYLRRLGDERRMKAAEGDYGYVVRLNEPKYESEQLFEVQLPIADSAMEFKGTLGEYTNVKRVGGVRAVMATKPEGVADPTRIHQAMAEYIRSNGLRALSGPVERFENILAIPNDCVYADLTTTIFVPVVDDDAPPTIPRLRSPGPSGGAS